MYISISIYIKKKLPLSLLLDCHDPKWVQGLCDSLFSYCSSSSSGFMNSRFSLYTRIECRTKKCVKNRGGGGEFSLFWLPSIQWVVILHLSLPSGQGDSHPTFPTTLSQGDFLRLATKSAQYIGREATQDTEQDTTGPGQSPTQDVFF